MKLLATIFFSFLFLVCAFAQTRNVIVNTNSAVVQPTNFWSADVTNARSGLGLGTAATNPASAFQPSSSSLTNLSQNNGANITNIAISNVVSLQSSLDQKLATNGSLEISNITGLSTSLGNKLSITGIAALSTNITGVVSLANGGTGATNASGARSVLGLGSAATNPSTAFQPSSSVLSNIASSNAINLTNIRATNIVGTVALASNVSVTLAISNGGTGATNAGGVRTNLGLGWSALTNTNVTNFRTAVGLGSEDNVFFNNVETENNIMVGGDLYVTNAISVGENGITFSSGSDSVTRSNLGLGWSALTNTNAGTSLVSVNSNGNVVSPTNFWQQAPIQTLVQTFTPTVNATNNGTNARNLYVYSMAPSVSGVTNTIVLPTNSATFDGDSATITHKGTTSTVTAVRQAGSATNLVTFNNTDESVKFIREAGQWTFYHNISYVEPIRFVDGGIESNKAESRTNLGLGWSALTNTNAATSLLGYTTNGAVVANTGTNMLTFTNSVSLSGVSGNDGILVWNPTDNEFYTEATFNGEIAFNNTTNAAATRTNLGLGLPALTNTSNTTFQQAIFTTNTPPTNAANVNSVGFNTAVSWMEIHIATNGTTNTFRIPLFK